MNKFNIIYILLFFGLVCFNANSQEYYRVNNEKYYNGKATLVLDNDHFEITVLSKSYNKYIGKLNGRIERLITPSNPGVSYFYSIINHYAGEYSKREESCVVLFYENEYGIGIIIHGDKRPNLLEGIYDGLYVKSTDIELNEKENILLEQIFFGIYDVNYIKNLLGYNVKYFLEIFKSHNVTRNEESIFIEGWIPGGNRYTNGIIYIENNNIYILFGDIRKRWDLEYHLYTNDEKIERYSSDIIEKLPQQIRNWRFFPGASKMLNIVS